MGFLLWTAMILTLYIDRTNYELPLVGNEDTPGWFESPRKTVTFISATLKTPACFSRMVGNFHLHYGSMKGRTASSPH